MRLLQAFFRANLQAADIPAEIGRISVLAPLAVALVAVLLVQHVRLDLHLNRFKLYCVLLKCLNQLSTVLIFLAASQQTHPLLTVRMEDVDVSASNGVDERSRGAEGDSGGPLRVLQLRVDVDAHVGHTAVNLLQTLRQFLWKKGSSCCFTHGKSSTQLAHDTLDYLF